MLKFNFNPKKSTQAAAYLLNRNAGDMDKYIWIKMLYLADRAALEKWEEPITGDFPSSMQFGPVLSNIYDLTKGDCPRFREDWEPFFADADAENRGSLKADPGTDELSRAELAVLDAVFEKFHNYTFAQMKAFCHALGEYEDVGRGSKSLPFERILAALGKSPEQIEDVSQRCREIQMAELLLAPR